MSLQTPQTPTFPTQKRTFGMILRDTWQLYRTHGGTLTRPLLKPIAQIILAGYGSIIVGYSILDYMLTHHQALVMATPWITAIGMLPPTILILYFFCQAFWNYLIYFVSLNLNVVEALENKPLDFKNAYQAIQQKSWSYTSLLTVYCFISMVPFILLFLLMIPAALLIATPSMAGPGFILMIFSYIVAGVSLLAVMAALVFLTPIFQITAFETITPNPLPVLLKSIRMIWGNFWRTFGLQLILIILTTSLLPLIAIQLMQFIHGTDLLNGFHTWLIALVLEGAAPTPGIEPIPLYAELYAFFNNHSPDVAKYLTETLISFTVNGLLLPLGTITFTLLYLDILAREK